MVNFSRLSRADPEAEGFEPRTSNTCSLTLIRHGIKIQYCVGVVAAIVSCRKVLATDLL